MQSPLCKSPPSPSVGNGVAISALHEHVGQPRLPAGYSDGHVLVPISLRPEHRSRVLPALELAMTCQPGALVTLLHVQPLTLQSEPWPGRLLDDAIDHLHRASQPAIGPAVTDVKSVLTEIATLVNREVPARIRDAMTLRPTCRVGDPAAEIARFANDQAVDLVILCAQRPGWRWSLWPRLADRILSLTERPVVLMPPRSKAQPAAPR